jgi:hypothetical protein
MALFSKNGMALKSSPTKEMRRAGMKLKKNLLALASLLALVLQLVAVGFLPTPASAVTTCAQGGVCTLGEIGPGGGVVFYVSLTPFTATGTPCDTNCYYLEAAPTSGVNAWTDAAYEWSGNSNTVIGTTGTAIGTGYANTLAIVGQSAGGSTASRAGTISRAYRGPNNLSDWYLPSKSELAELWNRRDTPGLIPQSGRYFWTSSESQRCCAWVNKFDASNTINDFAKNAGSVYVRPIRAFAFKLSNSISVSSTPRTENFVGETYTAAATAPGGVVVILIDASSASRCSISGDNVVSFNGAGSCLINFNQGGSVTYELAPQIQQSISIAIVVVSSEVAAAAARAAAEAAAAIRAAEERSARAEVISNLKSAQVLTVETFAKAGISGVTAVNFTAFQSELLALPEESRTDLNQILKVARKYEVVGNIGSDRVVTLQSNLFVEIGLIPAASKNKVAIVAAVKNLPADSRDTFAEIKAAIDAETARIQVRRERLAAALSRNATRYEKVEVKK